MEKKILALACDHGGYELKNEIKALLDKKGVIYADFGCDSNASVNYPDYAHKLCKAIQDGECYRGILFCGTGIGMSIAANKFKGIRAALCSDLYSAKFTRLHNNSNVLCIGALVTGAGLAKEIADVFLATEFMGGRHETRVGMITEIENEQ